MYGAIYVQDSKNTKISGTSKVDATYTSIKRTCPDSCSLKGDGCYAETSYSGIITRRLNRRARNYSPLKIARAEAKAIDRSYRGGSIPDGRMLRIHVAGDSRTVKGTRVISAAVSRWKKRGGTHAWSYTHAWEHVPRKEWGQVSVLASIETTKDVEVVRAQGYAPAIIVDQHFSEKAYQLPGSDATFIPCPQQTRDVACADCKLCMKADWLFSSNRGIAFAAHGVRRNNVKRHLTIVG